jgi:hypothetical protein
MPAYEPMCFAPCVEQDRKRQPGCVGASDYSDAGWVYRNIQAGLQGTLIVSWSTWLQGQTPSRDLLICMVPSRHHVMSVSNNVTQAVARTLLTS